MSGKKRAVTALAAALTILVPLLVWDNLRFETVGYTVKDKNLPKGFDGFRIVQVSDLHNNLFGKNQKRLIEAIKKEAPDLIAVTGDLIDSEKDENAFAFIKEAVKIAPCCYVNGNHEIWTGRYLDEIKPALLGYGVTVLDDEKIYLEAGGDKIALAGLSDSGFGSLDRSSALSALTENEPFTLLLSHRPDRFDMYANNNASLVLAGHAHGGQLRIPFTHQGLYAPNQGFFPKYTEGVYKRGDTRMVVSRGLGSGPVPIFRFNNCYQLVTVTLGIV